MGTIKVSRRTSVRLQIWNARGDLVRTIEVKGLDLPGAIFEAVCRGYTSGNDFSVIEPEGAPLKSYWSGQRADPRIVVPADGEDPRTISGPSLWELVKAKAAV